MTVQFADAASAKIPLHVIEEDTCAAWMAMQPSNVQDWAVVNGFAGGLKQSLVVPGPNGDIAMALIGYGTQAARARGRFCN